MAIRKSDLYSTLWRSCDELRGGMDASQYKDYVLVMLFLKYISDKAKTDKYFSIDIPQGCTFDDLIALKNKDEIGEKVNKMLENLAAENPQLSRVITVADFSDESKLGKGKDLIETVSNLIGVFQSSKLDFGKNRSDDDDLMGDAYEYLMKNFATESGKSKGQFYTPAEVSRVMAKVIGIQRAKEASESLYDPTCGSGSLLLKAQAEAPLKISIFGQEKDLATSGLAKMNMILHGEDTVDIRYGDTINDPYFKEENDQNTLKTFDYIVANPPFSTKSWLKSAKEEDIYGRWGSRTGVPPEKNGDYAFLLHIIRSLKNNGTAACILPHGVLFRGNAEYTIRKNILKYLKGIIGLPSNLFFGTGIPACILVLDKHDAVNRKGIFMIDAKDGFMKDGAKNRLREQDIRRIVDTWEAHKDVPHYARFVSYEEIAERHDYNLNLPRYIQAADKEVVQDIEAHLKGGLPVYDIEQLGRYWNSCPTLCQELFEENNPRKGYASLKVDKSHLRATIQNNLDYKKQCESFHLHFKDWRTEVNPILESLNEESSPKIIGKQLGNAILRHFLKDTLLVDGYDVYDVLMNYWNETMQDDCYLIVDGGWAVELYTPQPAAKKSRSGEIKSVKIKTAKSIADLACDLLPVEYVVRKYFQELNQALLTAEEQLSDYEFQKSELEETYKDDYLDESNFDGDKITDASLKKRIKHLKNSKGDKEEINTLMRYADVRDDIADTKRVIKVCSDKLLKSVQERYKTLTSDEIREMVLNDKWYSTLSERLEQQMQQVSQQLNSSVMALVERYEKTLPELDNKVKELKDKVTAHLKAMGFNF